ncbi:HepT-like ribonuclease domain-containing protein [Rhizobium sp. SYY.PMSO]|uniref:HepT-like ribonuclease domain-containing protein n=1 Tax=Rhizobium sp. SYY.PMSO TaxID=3382192 RepID=UPI000DE18A99
MSLDRLLAHLGRMQQAASEIGRFLRGVDQGAFFGAVEKQRAVGMNLMLIGEAAARIADEYPEFVVDHPELPWHVMQDFRNRITQGYFDIESTALWDIAQKSVPELLLQLDSVRHWRAEGE